MNEQLLISSFENADAASVGLGAFVGMLAGLGMAIFVVGLVLFVLTVIAWWRIFTKAGEKGWKSLIPFYNIYILFKIAGRSFWKYFGLAVGLGIAEGIADAVASTVVATIFGIATLVLAIYVIIELVKMYHGLSTKFGHGAGFTVGLVFLNTIFMLILGFGSSQYQANNN